MAGTKRLNKLRVARRDIYKAQYKTPDGKSEMFSDLIEKIEDLPANINRKVYVTTKVDNKDVIAELKEVREILSSLEIPSPLSEITVKNLGEIKMPEVKFPDEMIISNLGEIKLPTPIEKVVDTNSVVRAIEVANASSINRFNVFASSLYKKEKPVYVKILGRDNRVIDTFGAISMGGSAGGGGMQLPTYQATGLNSLVTGGYPSAQTIITSTGYAMKKGDFSGAGGAGATGPFKVLSPNSTGFLSQTKLMTATGGIYDAREIRAITSTGDSVKVTSTGFSELYGTMNLGTSTGEIYDARNIRLLKSTGSATGDHLSIRTSTGYMMKKTDFGGGSTGPFEVTTPTNSTSALTQLAVNISSTGGDETIISGSTGDIIRIHGLMVVFGADTDAILKNGTGTNITGAMEMLANGSIGMGLEPEFPYFVLSDNKDFIINLSTGSNVRGSVWYSKS